MRIVSAKIYVGSGLEPPENASIPGRYARHRVVVDPREVAERVEEVVSRRHSGSTITKGRGRWEGRGEPSLVVEVWETAAKRLDFFQRVAETAREIVDALDQVTVATVFDASCGKNVSYLRGAAASPRLRGRYAAV